MTEVLYRLNGRAIRQCAPDLSPTKPEQNPRSVVQPGRVVLETQLLHSARQTEIGCMSPGRPGGTCPHGAARHRVRPCAAGAACGALEELSQHAALLSASSAACQPCTGRCVLGRVLGCVLGVACWGVCWALRAGAPRALRAGACEVRRLRCRRLTCRRLRWLRCRIQGCV